MKNAFCFLLLFASIALAAETPREIFPSDYKASPCAPSGGCVSFERGMMADAANRFLLRQLEKEWLESHYDEMTTAIEPYCAKRATCLGSPGREWWFCNDLFAQELRGICTRKYPDAQTTGQHDYEQCMAFVDTYAAGVDQQAKKPAQQAQICAAAAEPAGKLHRMEAWVLPYVDEVARESRLRVYAIDTETHVPVEGAIAIEGQPTFTKDSPTGKPVTYYSFKLPTKLVRVPNAAGHSDVRPPLLTVTAKGYEPVVIATPVQVPTVKVSISPAAGTLRAGRNKVTVSAVDVSTGKPLEAQVMLGPQTVGVTNQPFELTLPRRARPEIWVTSLFDAFSDMVVVPAAK